MRGAYFCRLLVVKEGAEEWYTREALVRVRRDRVQEVLDLGAHAVSSKCSL